MIIYRSHAAANEIERSQAAVDEPGSPPRQSKNKLLLLEREYNYSVKKCKNKDFWKVINVKMPRGSSVIGVSGPNPKDSIFFFFLKKKLGATERRN